VAKTYAIADLHGRYDLLVQALNAIFRRPGGGTVITLGDYVDRGPESRQIISHLMTLRESPQAGWKVICLKGNHEDMMVETIRKPLHPDWWIGNGGGRTLISYGHAPKGLVDYSVVPESHLDWLDALPLMHVDKHRVFVHAGVNPNCPLDEQDPQNVMWKLYDDRDDGGHGQRHVVHGHHQFADGPILKKNRTDLDTFAWHTGRIVVGVFDDDVAGGPIEQIEIGSAKSRAVGGPDRG
jgi:serine/threonine protein phosphatase 1